MPNRLLPSLCCFLAGVLASAIIASFHHDDPPPESPVLPAHKSARTAEVIDAGRPDGAGDWTWDRLPVGSRVVISNPDSIVTVDVEGVRR
jgi:hypothetical protein